MKARTEELLYLLLWGAEKLGRPTFRNLTDSFEGWAYRRGFLRQLQDLEGRQFLERQPGSAASAIYRLSEAGRLIALGGRDPSVQWARRWDGCWRMVVFDLPQARASARARLRRFLQANHFGFLQNSVWISPDPLNPITAELSSQAADVESVVTLEARTAAGETDHAIVSGAWNFEEINERYERCLDVLGEFPDIDRVDKRSFPRLREWGQLERTAWLEALAVDPLLPGPLLPKEYLGKKVWGERARVLSRAGSALSPNE